MPNKEEYSKLYIDLSKRVAEMSKAVRLQVGAMIVKNHSIVSYGYNGTPSGDDNCCEVRVGGSEPQEGDRPEDLVTKDNVIHAEMNALLKMVGSTESVKGATMFITHAPCLRCSEFLVQTGAIKKVVYGQEYKNLDGVEYLKKKGIDVEQLIQMENDSIAHDSSGVTSIPNTHTSIPDIRSKELPKIVRASSNPDVPSLEVILQTAKELGGLQWQKAVLNIMDLVSPINEFMVTLILEGSDDVENALKKNKITYAIVYKGTWIIYDVDTPISVHS